MIKKIYPIGTKVIIQRNNQDMLIMIIGRVIKINDDSFHDYAGIYYPVGYIGKKNVIKFQEEEIKKVCIMGYVGEKEKEETGKMKEILSAL